jgi:hypothetical protein
VQIHTHRDRLTGTALAGVGIASGLAFTALTLLLFVKRDLIPLDAWWRARTLGAQVDTSGALEVVSRDGNLVLRRPSEAWGRVQGDRSDDAAVGDVQDKRDLLLANVARHAFIDVGRVTGLTTLEEYRHGRRDSSMGEPSPLVQDLQPPRPSLLGDDEETTPWGVAQPQQQPLHVRASDQQIPVIPNWEAKEWICDSTRGGQKWTFIIRVFKKKAEFDPRSAEPVFVVRGYAPSQRFAAVEEDLRAALDTVSLPK